MKIKTIDVQAKEWRDRVNGNSYFSALVVLNYGMRTEKRFRLPFQYGYGNHYEYMAFQKLKKEGYIKGEDTCPSLAYRDAGIIYRASIQEGCKQRDTKQWGETCEN